MENPLVAKILDSLRKEYKGSAIEFKKLNETLTTLCKGLQAPQGDLNVLLKGISIVKMKGVKGDQGKPGHTPVFRKDFWLPKEEKEFIASVTPSFYQYIDGKLVEAKQELKPVKGKDYWTERDVDIVVKRILKLIPKPKNGKNGISPKLPSAKEIAASIKLVLTEKDGKEIVQAINSITSADDKFKIDAKHIKGIKSVVQNFFGGGTGGSSSSSGLVSYGIGSTVVSGTQQSVLFIGPTGLLAEDPFVFAYTPLTGLLIDSPNTALTVGQTSTQGIIVGQPNNQTAWGVTIGAQFGDGALNVEAPNTATAIRFEDVNSGGIILRWNSVTQHLHLIEYGGGQMIFGDSTAGTVVVSTDGLSSAGRIDLTDSGNATTVSIIGDGTASFATGAFTVSGIGDVVSGGIVSTGITTSFNISTGTFSVSATGEQFLVDGNLGNVEIAGGDGGYSVYVGDAVDEGGTSKFNIYDSTQPQFELGYAVGNKLTVTVDSAGNASLILAGTTPTFTFSNSIVTRGSTTAAETACLYLTNGTVMTAPEVGAVERAQDKVHFTIATGTARKEFTLNDAALTSGRVPFATTNGRLTDSANFTFATATLTLGVSNSVAGILRFQQTGGVQNTSIVASTSGSSFTLTLPSSTGSNGQALTTNGSGGLSFATLAANVGGTGQTVYAVGDLLYASTTTALSKLADVATGNALISGGVSNAPSWGKIGLTTHVSGILPVANGGTGVDGTAGTQFIQVAVSDETTDLTTGTAKVTFRMPYAMTLVSVRASVNTAPTGSTIIVDINESGSTILSTRLTIDASEKTSTTATPAVISDSALADDAEITIDIDQIGSTIAGKGLKVTLIGTRV